MIAFADPPPAVVEPVKPGRTIEELTQTVSASRLSTWLQCRLKFHFRYVAGVPKPPTAALHVGNPVSRLGVRRQRATFRVVEFHRCERDPVARWAVSGNRDHVGMESNPPWERCSDPESELDLRRSPGFPV
jgi:hypothetical protein